MWNKISFGNCYSFVIRPKNKINKKSFGRNSSTIPRFGASKRSLPNTAHAKCKCLFNTYTIRIWSFAGRFKDWYSLRSCVFSHSQNLRPPQFSSGLVACLFIGRGVKSVVDSSQKACYQCWLDFTEASAPLGSGVPTHRKLKKFVHVYIDQLWMHRTCEANSPPRSPRQFSPAANAAQTVNEEVNGNIASSPHHLVPLHVSHATLRGRGPTTPRTPGGSTPGCPSWSSTKETNLFNFPHKSFKVDILGNRKFHRQPSSPCRPSRRFLRACRQSAVMPFAMPSPTQTCRLRLLAGANLSIRVWAENKPHVTTMRKLSCQLRAALMPELKCTEPCNEL